VSTTIYFTKEKIFTLNVVKKICIQAWNRLETFWQTWARSRPDPKRPAQLATLLHILWIRFTSQNVYHTVRRPT